MKKLNVAIIGQNFMGKAHSNAWKKASFFFDLAVEPVLKVACGQNQTNLKAFADNWGWEETESDWQKVVERDDIDIIDIATPQHLHHPIALAAAKAGKHIFCEKPIALGTLEAKEMLDIAEANKVVHYLNHNYRKVPAVALAKQLLDEGKLGKVYQWRGTYLQDWIIDPEFPLTWQLQKEFAGAGPHYDLNSHSVDLARYLVGEIESVTCMKTNFVKERPLPSGNIGLLKAGSTGEEKGEVTVEDAAFMLAQFENGALGSFEASRFAAGRRNYNCFEIYGSEGSLIFNLERPNELQYYSIHDQENVQGFRTILTTESTHPYVSHWWPAGHNIGYEHAFVHAVVEFIDAIENKTKVNPTFYDGWRTMQVLDAGLKSATLGKQVSVEKA